MIHSISMGQRVARWPALSGI